MLFPPLSPQETTDCLGIRKGVRSPVDQGRNFFFCEPFHICLLQALWTLPVVPCFVAFSVGRICLDEDS